MGVVNLTPDSFSDGGRFEAADAAVAHADRLVEEGAEIIDLGAESTRPGATPVEPDAEWTRLEPVLTRLVGRWGTGITISVDTRWDHTMERSLDAGAGMINDVTGRAAARTLEGIARRGAGYIGMHFHRDPATMQKEPLAGRRAVAAVTAFFEQRAREARCAGLPEEQVWLDPGIGFGKTDPGNLQLIAEIPRLSRQARVAIGLSRKSWIGRALGIELPAERDGPSKMIEFGAALLGADLIRTHSVGPLAQLRRRLADERDP